MSDCIYCGEDAGKWGNDLHDKCREAARVALATLRAGWSKTPPTEPGWYFALHAGWLEIANVSAYRSTDELFATLTGTEFPYRLDDFTHWLGPLPEPPEVKDALPTP